MKILSKCKYYESKYKYYANKNGIQIKISYE